jgi:sugar phosphate isomerase/epimerase
MPAPIALQLYTVRDILSSGFEAGVRRVAEIGYEGVEAAGFPGTTPAAAAKLFKELGLTVCAAHLPAPVGEKKNEVLDTVAALGIPYSVVAWQPPDLFTSVDGIRRVCDMLNEGHAVAKANGFRLGYHNHWAECGMVDGRPAIEYMAEFLAPDVIFEVDTYWAKTAGLDPAEVVRKLGKRAPLLHIKDGPANKVDPMTAVGEGIIDWEPVIDAGAATAEWLIVEQDRSAKPDMMAEAKASYDYLVGKGFAHGKR